MKTKRNFTLKNSLFITTPLIIIIFLTFGGNLPAQASVIFNCSSALEKVAKLDERSEILLKEDVKKQLAELLVLRTPILFSKSHLKSLEHAVISNSLIIKDVAERTSNYTVDKMRDIASTTWANLLDFYVTDPCPIASKTACLDVSVQEFEQLKALMEKIDNNYILKNAALELLTDSASKVLTEKENSRLAKNRRKFYEKLPGQEKADIEVETDLGDPSHHTGQPQKMTLAFEGTLAPGEVLLTRHFSQDQKTSENVNLVTLITKEYPILWTDTFTIILTKHLDVMGLTPKEFYKKFKDYSEEDLDSVSQSLWSRMMETYSTHVPVILDKKDKGFSPQKFDLFRAAASDLKLSLGDYLQTRLVLNAINENPEARKRVTSLIRNNLKDTLQFVFRNSSAQQNLVRTSGIWLPKLDLNSNSKYPAESTINMMTMIFGGAGLLPGFMGLNIHDPTMAAIGFSPVVANVASRVGISAYSGVVGKTRQWLAKRQKNKLIEKAKQSVTHGESEE